MEAKRPLDNEITVSKGSHCGFQMTLRDPSETLISYEAILKRSFSSEANVTGYQNSTLHPCVLGTT
jgi:hypothetical protein